jgi:hypothetical protein
MKRFALFAFLSLLFVLSTVSAAYTHTFVEDSYVKGETAVFSGISTDNSDKGDSYSICFYDQTGTELECDTGTVPSSNNLFGGEYIIPTSSSISTLTANLTINAVNEAEDSVPVTAATNGTLLISNITYSSDPKVGKVESVRFYVTDYQGNPVTNTICSILASDSQDLTPIDGVLNGMHSYSGFGAFSKILITQAYEEDKTYLVEIACSCSAYDTRRCFTNATGSLGNQVGRSGTLFYISKWLSNVNTVTDASSYTLNDEYITVCANVTNDGDKRIPLEIVYNWRCGSGDDATDRVVISEYSETRGISANTTQNQCANLPIKNVKGVTDRNNSCYAATEVHVLDEVDKIIYTYSTTSTQFNFISQSNIIEDENMQTGLMTLAIIFGVIIFALLFIGNQLSDEHSLLKLFIYIAVIFLLLAGAAIGITASQTGFTLLNAIKWLVVVVVIYILVYVMYIWHKQANSVVPK